MACVPPQTREPAGDTSPRKWAGIHSGLSGLCVVIGRFRRFLVGAPGGEGCGSTGWPASRRHTGCWPCVSWEGRASQEHGVIVVMSDNQAHRRRRARSPQDVDLLNPTEATGSGRIDSTERLANLLRATQLMPAGPRPPGQALPLSRLPFHHPRTGGSRAPGGLRVSPPQEAGDRSEEVCVQGWGARLSPISDAIQRVPWHPEALEPRLPHAVTLTRLWGRRQAGGGEE